MPTQVSRLLLLASVLFAVSSATRPQQAEAQIYGGYAGYPVNGADRSCFAPTASGVVNTCSGGTRAWEMVIPFSTLTSQTINAWVNFNDSCWLAAVSYIGHNQQSGFLNSIDFAWGNGFQKRTYLLTPISGAMFFGCNVPSGGKIATVERR